MPIQQTPLEVKSAEYRCGTKSLLLCDVPYIRVGEITIKRQKRNSRGGGGGGKGGKGVDPAQGATAGHKRRKKGGRSSSADEGSASVDLGVAV